MRFADLDLRTCDLRRDLAVVVAGGRRFQCSSVRPDDDPAAIKLVALRPFDRDSGGGTDRLCLPAVARTDSIYRGGGLIECRSSI